MVERTQQEGQTMREQWEEVKPAGYLLNLLAAKFHPVKMELGFVNGKDYAYRLTMPNGQPAIYIDRGDCRKLLDGVSLTKMVCQEHLRAA